MRCAPVQLENVRVEYDEKPINGSYPELSQVEFSCDEGLELQGERCAKCRAAVWNNLDLMPTCVKGKKKEGSQLYAELHRSH